MNEKMNSYTNVDVAHGGLLLVICLEKEKPLGNKKPPPTSVPPVKFRIASGTSKESQS
jgi:hypothetical protein